MLIWIFQVGGILQKSSSAAIDFTEIVECCVTGEAVSCITANIYNGTEFCINAITPSKF